MKIQFALHSRQVSAIPTHTDAAENVSSYHIIFLDKIRFTNTAR
jgi:hypothetical protein